MKTNQPIAPFTTFKIGGNARYLIEALQIDDVIDALSFAKSERLPFFVLGKGSNTLMSDKGFDGVVIVNKVGGLEIEDGCVRVGGGYNFSLLGIKTAKMGLSGLEFASGIPGTVGGAIFMNAGANGQETADRLVTVDFVNEDGVLQQIDRSELTFNYRTSSFQKMKGVIVGAQFALSEHASAREDQQKILDYRLDSQPYKAKTAGCCFRNPEGDSAGRLIETCGLKGVKKGGAVVSTVHANFIENHSEATAEDVEALISHVQNVVEEKTGIKLELEVQKVGI